MKSLWKYLEVVGFSGDGGPAAQAQLSLPNAVAVDAKGDLYVVDYRGHCIRKAIR